MAYRCKHCKVSYTRGHRPDCPRQPRAKQATQKPAPPIERPPRSDADRAARKAQLYRIALAIEAGWREAEAERAQRRAQRAARDAAQYGPARRTSAAAG